MGKRGLLGLCLLGFASLAQAEEAKLTLSVTVDQAKLIVETLGQIGCQNVTQLAICQQATELLRNMREQVKAQQK